MSTPISERKLANAIRVLSFDAVQSQLRAPRRTNGYG